MTVHFPKTKPLAVTQTKATDTVGQVGKDAKEILAEAPADAMLPAASATAAERHVPVQGNSLIERTQRYLRAEISKLEVQLEPLVSQMQANGWYSPATLKAIGAAADAATIAKLIGSSAAAESLGTGADVDQLAKEILASPAKPSSMLLLSTGRRSIETLGGAAAKPAGDSVSELVMRTRHLSNLGMWVDRGFTRFTSLEQMDKELYDSRDSAVTALLSALAPVTLDEVRAAQTDYQHASGLPNTEREAARSKVLDGFVKTMSRIPAPLWAELNSDDVREGLENLLRRRPSRSDFEQANNVVALFRTDTELGNKMWQPFDTPIGIDSFKRGGFIPDTIGRSDALWT